MIAYLRWALCGWLACCLPAHAATGFPNSDESLHYTINWPSGLSLGEANLQAHKSAGRWSFEFTLNAAIPAFAVSDRYQAEANEQFCSLEFEKQTSHGPRRTREKTTFDYKKGTARRATVNGGKSDIGIPACAHDALTFLFYARQELAQGRVPPAETVFAGAPYHLRMEYTGAQTIPVNDARTETDRVAVSVKGPNSDVSFEAFFARDAARTPLVIRVPFALGTFSMELVR